MADLLLLDATDILLLDTSGDGLLLEADGAPPAASNNRLLLLMGVGRVVPLYLALEWILQHHG